MTDLPSRDDFPKFKAAAVHAAPVFLDRDATIDKMGGLVAEAAQNGARLVVFAESFVPAFPLWNMVHAPVDQHRFFHALYEQSLPVPGDETERIAAMAFRHGVYISVGITERSPVSMGGLYNTNLLFDPSGRLLNRHRKIVPTWAEKLTWANGDGSELRPVTTELGRIGMLICGENTNPLARYALLAQGEQVHISTYPAVWPFRRAGAGDNYDLRRAIEIRAAAHSFEGKVFNIVAAAALDERTVELVAGDDARVEELIRAAPRGASLIIGPTGEPISDVLVDDEGILYADIDIAQSIEPKQAHDIIGYYQRFDLFQLRLNQSPQLPIDFQGSERAEPGPAREAGEAIEPHLGEWERDVRSGGAGERV
jgi:nitrilase